MLSGSFFRIENLTIEEGRVSAHLHLDASHIIFSGHFPGLPVVPGVCMVQMIKEVFEEVLGQKTKLASARNIKFLHVLDPSVYREVHTEIQFKENLAGFSLAAKIHLDQTIFFKMDAVFAI